MNKLRTLWILFFTFFKIGSFTFGGGLAMLPLIQREAVDVHHWVNEEEIVDYFAVAQSVPGVVAVNSSIMVGNKVLGKSGAVFAAMGIILPAFISIMIIFAFLSGLSQNPYVDKVFSGIKAASVALILLASIKLGKAVLKSKEQYVIFVVAFLLIVALNISAVWSILFGAAAGYTLYFVKRGSTND